MALQHFKFGWTALESALNELVDAINACTPQEGQGTLTEQGGSKGTMIHVSTGKSAPSTPQQPQDGGGGGAGAGGQWLTVTTVDPATCAQSTIQVWAQIG